MLNFPLARSHCFYAAFVLWTFGGLFIGCGDPEPDRSTGDASLSRDAVDSTYVMEHYGVGYCGLVFIDKADAAMTLTINGFPVRYFPMGRWSRDTLCPRIETGLIGENNDLALRVEPFLSTRGSRLQVGDVHVAIHARRMGQGPTLPALSLAKRTQHDVWEAYTTWGNALLPVWREYVERQNADLEANPDRRPWALDSMRAYVRRNPLVISMRFTNRYGPDFSDLFEDAPVIEGTPADSARLTRYALHLRDLMAERDTAALYEAFVPMFRHSDRVRETRGIRSASELGPKERAFKHMIIDGLELEFGADDVVLEKWSDGRIWELRRGYEPLFSQKQGGGGFREVFVAQLGDTLRVVR